MPASSNARMVAGCSAAADRIFAVAGPKVDSETPAACRRASSRVSSWSTAVETASCDLGTLGFVERVGDFGMLPTGP